MEKCCSLSNTGLVTALSEGTAIVKVYTYNKKYYDTCTITIVAGTLPPAPSEWSSNENNILLHGSSGNVYIHSLTAVGAGGYGYGLEINSSGRWSVSSNKSWITPTETWSGNSAVKDYGLFFNVAENNENVSRVATLTGTNLDTNDTSIFTITQEVKVAESQIKLFIISGNNDFTNGTISIGDNYNTQTITIIPKIYQDSSWVNYNFDWGGSITNNSDYIQSISPSLSGSLNQFNTSKELVISFIGERTSSKNVVLQVKSNITTPNQALSTITFSLSSNVSNIDGKMDIRLFINNVEYTQDDEIEISESGGIYPITVKTYRGSGTNWIEDNTCVWGANLFVDSEYFEDPACNPVLTNDWQQFAGQKVLNVTFYNNPHPFTGIFHLDLFSWEDGSGYFSNRRAFRFNQNEGNGNYLFSPNITEYPNTATVIPTMTNQYTTNFDITEESNSSQYYILNINTNIFGCPIVYDTESSSSGVYLQYNGANYSNTNNKYIPKASDTEEMKKLKIVLDSVTEITNKNLVLTITTPFPTSTTYRININITHGIELLYYLQTDVAVLTELNGEDTTIIYSFNINSNIMWQISSPDIVTPPYGTGALLVSGQNNAEISFSLKQNTTGSTRTADIVIIPDINSPDYSLYSNIQPVTVTLSQNPARTLTIDKSEINIPQTSGNTVYSFTISSNTNWEIVWVDSWILDENGGTNLTTQGNGNSTINFRVENNSVNSRTTLVTVKTSDNYITRTLSVIQAGENQTPEYKMSLVSNSAQSDLGPAYTINVIPETYSCTVYFICSLVKKTTDINQDSTDWYSSNPTNYLYIKQNNLSDITISQYNITNSNTVTGSFTEQLNTIKGNGIIATATIPEYNLELTSNVLRVGRTYNNILAGVIHSSDIFIYESQNTSGQLENIVLGANIEYNNPNADINGEVTIYYATDISSFTANIRITDTNSGWLFFMATERLNITASKGSNNNNIVFETIPMSLSTSGDSLQKVYFYITGASVNNSNLLDMQGYQNSYADNYTIFVNKS